MQNCGENGAAERMCRRKLAGLSEPKWRLSSPQRGALGPQRVLAREESESGPPCMEELVQELWAREGLCQAEVR